MVACPLGFRIIWVPLYHTNNSHTGYSTMCSPQFFYVLTYNSWIFCELFSIIPSREVGVRKNTSIDFLFTRLREGALYCEMDSVDK